MDPSAILCCIIALILTVDANPGDVDRSAQRKRTVTDPVSNFLSELGDLFLDIDETIASQTAPKVSYEDRIAAQIFRPLQQPPSEYFGRIRENYRTLQQRVGSLIDETLTPLEESFSADWHKKREPKLKKLSQIPSTSLKSQRNGHRTTSTEEHLKTSDRVNDNRKNMVTEVKDLEIARDEPPDDSATHLRDFHRNERPTLKQQSTSAEDQVRKIVAKVISDAKRSNEFLGRVNSNALDHVSSVLVRRMGDVPEEESKPQERILGDLLYSESRFDKYLRQLLQTHGKWVLDNPLLSRWRDASKTSREKITDETTSEVATSVDASTEPLVESSEATLMESTTGSTEAYSPSSESQDEATEPEEVSENLPESNTLMSASYYRIDDEGKTKEEIDIVLSEDSEDEETDVEEIEDEETEDEVEEKMKDTVILAFTPDGIPLKLRMGPEIENPVQYLHKVLRSAGVSLKVPVESYEDLEPVGKEVILLGLGADITRSVYIDASNRNELKSLLRTLMKSKASGTM